MKGAGAGCIVTEAIAWGPNCNLEGTAPHCMSSHLLWSLCRQACCFICAHNVAEVLNNGRDPAKALFSFVGCWDGYVSQTICDASATGLCASLQHRGKLSKHRYHTRITLVATPTRARNYQSLPSIHSNRPTHSLWDKASGHTCYSNQTKSKLKVRCPTSVLMTTDSCQNCC